MTEPLKPRIDFAQPLDVEPEQAYKTAHAFSEPEARSLPQSLPPSTKWMTKDRPKRS